MVFVVFLQDKYDPPPAENVESARKIEDDELSLEKWGVPSAIKEDRAILTVKITIFILIKYDNFY